MSQTNKRAHASAIRSIRRSFNLQRRHSFYSDMAKFVEAGITPFSAIERMRDVAKPRRRLRWMVRLMSAVHTTMKEGTNFAMALAPFIPAEEGAMLRAGEAGSDLHDALRVLSDLLDKRRQVKSSLVSTLVPSGVMLAVLLALMIFILQTVLKEARKLMPEDQLAKLVLAPLYFTFGETLLASLPVLLPLVAILVVVVTTSLPRWKPSNARKWFDRNLPPYSMYARVQSSFFLITTAAMMEAGSPFAQAVEDIRKNATPWTKAHTKRMSQRLAHGKNEGDSMQVGMLPQDVEDRIAIYKLIDDYKYIMRVTARDSMEILLKRVAALGGAVKIFVMLLLAIFIVFTIFSIGEIALSMQSAVNSTPRP